LATGLPDPLGSLNKMRGRFATGGGTKKGRRLTGWGKEKELKIWGRAQLEAARSPKSDWKYNLWG